MGTSTLASCLDSFYIVQSKFIKHFNLNEAAAIGVGIAMEKERITLLLAAVALAAAAVSVTGGVAFIGLLAPHIAKGLVGPRNQLFIPVAILLGGWLLLIADTIGHNIADPNGIPAGIISAVIGAPYFVYLLLKNNKQTRFLEEARLVIIFVFHLQRSL